MMKAMRAAIGLAAVVGLACHPHRPNTIGSLNQIIVVVPDSAMRERWKRAAEAHELPPLSTIPVPDQVTLRRVPALVQQPAQPPRPPRFDSATVADVRLFSAVPVDSYRGPFAVTEVAPGRIAGRLEGRAQPYEVYYKLPGGHALQLAAGAQLTLALRDEVVDASLQREVLLLSPEGRLLLFALSGGGHEPYARTVEPLPLSLRQQPPGGDSVSAVTVSFLNQEFSLRPGERHQVKEATGTVEFFLLASQFAPPARAMLAEGDAYHVRLFAYRVE